MAFQFSPVAYQKLLDAERLLMDAIPEMDKAEECGVDCQAYRNAAKVQLEHIAKMRANFAPNGMRKDR